MKYSKNTSELITKYVLAQRIIYNENLDNPNVLIEDSVRQPILGDVNFCTFKAGSSVVLDFGKELSGGVDITVHESAGVDSSLRITFGESVMESMSDIGEQNASNDHSIRDSVVKVSKYSNFRVGQTGFRFVRIQTVSGEVQITGVRGVFEYRDIPYRGSFECNDTLLNNIWHTGVHTIHLNMQNYLWDGIKRDRLVWIGDMHAEVAGVGCIFGDHPIVEKSLSLIKDFTPENEWMNTIPAYSFWWLIIRYEWYMQTGDVSALLRDGDYIISLINRICSCVKDNGTDDFGVCMGCTNADFPYATYFIDWENYKKEDSHVGFFAVLIMALEACKRICDILGNTDSKMICYRTEAIIRKMKFKMPKNRQMAALGVLADVFDADMVNKNVFLREPIADVSAYMGYYTLLAKAKIGDISGALDIIRGYWGRMIELGATSFWEAFDYTASEDAVGIDCIVPAGKKDAHLVGGAYCYEGYRRSLCHGWACGPTPFISRYVLGINPVEPGFKKTCVKPNLGGLNYVKGTYPTPYGDIIVEVENKNGKINSNINAPREIEILK